ncbi:MAG: hypothetical protein JWR39_1047 [Devosia sp.]|nr:hypothetical protein [Devosia sp.]
MRMGSSGPRAASKARTQFGMAAVGMLLSLALAACTTVEGTNALTDVGTFEREVMTSTARGVGLIEAAPAKEDLTQARAPLVLPRDASTLPTPTQSAAAQLPANSSQVRIDTANMSEADLARLRNAKVVDMRTLSGRPLTQQESTALTARMQGANMQVTANNKRPLYLPPDEYFARVGNADLLCRTPSGEVVSLRDSRCPADVRRAIEAQQPQVTSPGILGRGSDAKLDLD